MEAFELAAMAVATRFISGGFEDASLADRIALEKLAGEYHLKYGPTHVERWAFTETELANLDQLNLAAHDQLVVTVPGHELGVIVYRNGEVSNHWEDGTRGVPADVTALADDEETLYCPNRNEYADQWRNVEVDTAGKFRRLVA
jgi:hypothetical protein